LNEHPWSDVIGPGSCSRHGHERNGDISPRIVRVNMSATMKPIGWVVLVLLVIVLWFSLRTRQNRNSSKASQPAGSERSGATVYLGCAIWHCKILRRRFKVPVLLSPVSHSRYS